MIYNKPKFLFVSWGVGSIFKNWLLVLSLLFFSISNPTFCYADSCSIVNVGASYGDGTVFCVSNTSDTSQCVTSGAGYYGLFMANEDQVNYYSNSNHGITWASVSSQTNAVSESDGAANTATIIAALPSDNSINNAAWLCHNYSGGWYTAWYLPAKDELNKMYHYAAANNLVGDNCAGSKFDGIQCLLGGYYKQSKVYWSSSESSGDSYYVWSQRFDFGDQGKVGKDVFWFGVRAVRAFNYSTIQLVNNLISINKAISKNSELEFTALDFTDNFSNSCGNSLAKIKITSLPSYGVLKLAGNLVSLEDEINVTDLTNLIYGPNSGYVGNDSFSWNGSDEIAYADSDATVTIEIIDSTASSVAEVSSHDHSGVASSSNIGSLGSSMPGYSISSNVVSGVSGVSVLGSDVGSYDSSNTLAKSSLGGSSDFIDSNADVTPDSSEVDPDKGGNVGAIVGGVVGGAIVATVVGVAVAKGALYYYHHHVRPIAREIGGAELGGV